MAHNFNRVHFESDDLKTFFIDQLNKSYCAKSHLYERFSELEDHPAFVDLKFAITSVLQDIQTELSAQDKLFSFLQVNYDFENCVILPSLENDFFTIQEFSENKVMRDLSIIHYLQRIENGTSLSCSSMERIGRRLGDSDLKNAIMNACGKFTAVSAFLQIFEKDEASTF